MLRKKTFRLVVWLVLLCCVWLTTPLAYSQTGETHIVQPGETLSQIAKENGVPLIDLLRINALTNADAIYVGQVLILPDGDSNKWAATHLVQAGETLSQIAQRYDVSVQALMTANDLTTAEELYWGQTLRIPRAGEIEITSTRSNDSQEEAQSALAPDTATTNNIPDQHTVQRGETASQIAKGYGIELADLLRANNIANADTIFVGQVLSIPDSATAAPIDAGQTDSAPDETASSDAPVDEIETPASTDLAIPPLAEHPHASLNRAYTVQSGDTPNLIALRQGVDREALLQLNNLPSSARLVAGQRLLLPATDKELWVETPAEYHVVQAGDSLSVIAKNYGLTLAELMAANRLSNPDSISVGQKLVIPGRVVDGAQEPVKVGPARSGYFFYTVRRGDTLSELARDLESTQIALIEYNDLPDESTVFAGMELRVPYGPPPLPVTLPPAPVSGTSFLVSLSRQQCWVFQGSAVLHQWNCSTGYGEWRTRTGAFAVQSKIENAQSNAYRLDMPYWLGIYDVGRYENGIHGLPVEWATGKKIWTRLVGQPATFGCAMLDDVDAKTLFDLAYIGMPVYIIQ